MALLEAPPNDPDRVVKVLREAPAMAARVLSVTNSAAIGVVGEINDIRRAVIHMGANRARAIAMAFAAQMMAEETGLDPDIAHQLWVNSLEKAHLGRLVAQAIDPQTADQAYTLGLIQDVGLSALWCLDPRFYESMASQPEAQRLPLYIREQEHFGIDHAAVGNHLLKTWDASPILCEEVHNHHQPVLIRSDSSPANLGNLIAGILPHVGETMTPDRIEWLTAVHTLFLSKAFETPKDMLLAATRSAREVHGSAPNIKFDTALRQRLLTEVHVGTASMVRQLCEMENLLTQKFQQVNELQFEAVTDPLTQALNRRGFDRLAERRLQTAVERGLPICVIVLDLDGFKQVNDTYGHDAGDRMLKALSDLVRKNIASGDLFGRLGGDEFAILQVNVGYEDAERIVRRVASSIRKQPIELGDGQQVPLKFSVGAAVCQQPTTKTLLKDLIQAADEAMYASKRSGSEDITVVRFQGRQQAG
ncbi:MAG: hypothetical protein Kow00105_13690 [Phycisphaeraceae bacterium]